VTRSYSVLVRPFHSDMPRPGPGQPDPAPVLEHPPERGGHRVFLRVEPVDRNVNGHGDKDFTWQLQCLPGRRSA
jgi:hypothetical protein